MRIIYTSDTHSYLFPTDFVEKRDVNMGLMRVAESFYKDIDTIVIDGGDTLQGSPLSKFVFDKNIHPYPQAKIFNAMKLDIVVPGNHDFNYGYDVLYEYFSDLDATLLCANLIDKKALMDIKKHVVATDSTGLRIGFSAIVTDYVNIWEKKENLEFLEITDAYEAARSELSWLEENADISVLIYHGGFETNLKTDEILAESNENIASKIAMNLDYDLILSAHQHMEIPLTSYHGTKVIQCPPNATKYAEITLDKNGISGEIKGPKSKSFLLERKFQPLRDEIEKWLDQGIGEIEKEITPPTLLESALNGSRIADFFNNVQLEATGADISATALTNILHGFGKNLTLRDIVSNYPFANTLVVVEVGEKELRLALERSAEYFDQNDGKISISKSFLEPKVENYNYDYYLGISYTFDISKPIGKRVSRLLYNGEEIGNRRLKLCLNNYRASGTGGYDVFKSCKVIKEFGENVQDLAIDYLLRSKGPLTWPKADFKTTL